MARVARGRRAPPAPRRSSEAIALAETPAELRDDLQLLPWLADRRRSSLREAETGRALLEHALDAARARAAIGALPFVLNLIARDQATTDRCAIAEATYREAIALARESGQRTALAFGLAGLAWLEARRGREDECRAHAAEALRAVAGAGDPPVRGVGDGGGGRARAWSRQAGRGASRNSSASSGCWTSWASPTPTCRRRPSWSTPICGWAVATRPESSPSARSRPRSAKGQPWSLARALRCRGLMADEAGFAAHFERGAASCTPDPGRLRAGRTPLAYGERLRRARNRVRAREQLRAAAETFERLDARPGPTARGRSCRHR